MPVRWASIILDVPTQALDSPYSYAIPESMGEAALVGCAVLVPLGSRKVIGFVVAVTDDPDSMPENLDPMRLKPIEEVLSRPFFDEAGAACALHLSEAYLAPLSSCIRLFVPPGGIPRLLRSGDSWVVERASVGEVDDRWVRLTACGESLVPRKGAVKQSAIIDALREGSSLRVAELEMELGSISSSLKSLEAQGAVLIERRRRMRGIDEAPVSPLPDAARPDLTCGQAAALEAVDAACRAREGRVIVVDGVTGSGKTEVYLRAIEEQLAQGRSAIVLVPEISLTPQTVARFRGRFADAVAVLHSRMGKGERFDQWDLIRSGRGRVVVGARSALFAPVSNLGLIVIDEEHESSYKQDSSPRYVARDVAEWMVRRSGAALVLGSATPSIEALQRCERDPFWSRVELPERVNGKPLPSIEVVDMAREFGGGSRSMFSHALASALEDVLRAGEKAVLMLNQRGFARFILCRSCGFVPECPSCSTSLTYHERGRLLMCHHCGYSIPAPSTCPACGSPYLGKFGAGTQRVETELRSIIDGFEGVDSPVIRMDSDTTRGKGAHRRLLESFAAAESAVLLGTQMIAKGLDFDDVTLVGVINADTMLKLPDFRSAERTFDLIEQVAGRAGRSSLPGRVLVQTYWPDSEAIRAAASYDRPSFLADELPKRKALRYPPFARLANILIWGRGEVSVRESAFFLSQEVEAAIADRRSAGWSMLPATPCVMAKLRGMYRWHIVVRAPLGGDIAEALAPLFRKRKSDSAVNVAVDIDPCDML